MRCGPRAAAGGCRAVVRAWASLYRTIKYKTRPDRVEGHPTRERERDPGTVSDSVMRVTPSFCVRRILPKKHNFIKSSKTRLFRL